MRPPDHVGVPTHEPLSAAYVDELHDLMRPHGVTRVGVAPATVLHRARTELRSRLEQGLVDGMQFTFKNPERSTDPQHAVRDARSILVAARPYLLDEAFDDTPGAPTAPGGDSVEHLSHPRGGDRTPGLRGRIARYAWLDHYAPLRTGLWAAAARLRADGWKAVPFADDNSIVDREVAYLAGLGWFGKNANLLLPGAGSWFVLGCVVTTAPLPTAAAPVSDGCGTCQRCIDACPTGAIVAPGVIDAATCLAWQLQKPGIMPRALRAAVGDRMYGCDDCQEVCPPSVRLGRRETASPRDGEPPRRWVDVVEILRMDDPTLLDHWGRWYLADRDPRWARRNALVVLGNLGGTDGPRDGSSIGSGSFVPHQVAAVVRDYVAHTDPILPVHAVWAAGRLGLHDVLPSTDPHPDVRDELAAARGVAPSPGDDDARSRS